MWHGLEDLGRPRWFLRGSIAILIVFSLWLISGFAAGDFTEAMKRSYVYAKIASNVVPNQGETMMVDWVEGQLCFTKYSVPEKPMRSAVLIEQICPMTWNEYVGHSVTWQTHEGAVIRQLDFL